MDITSHTREGRGRYKKKQAGAKLGQAQVKLEVIVKVGVEDRCIYLILKELKLFLRLDGWWVLKMRIMLTQLSTKL